MVMLGAVSAAEFLRMMHADCVDFTHDDARSRTFRWGEDGIAGVSDAHGLQNIAFAFWNEKEYVGVAPHSDHANGWQRLSERTAVRLVESTGKPW